MHAYYRLEDMAATADRMARDLGTRLPKDDAELHAALHRAVVVMRDFLVNVENAIAELSDDTRTKIATR